MQRRPQPTEALRTAIANAIYPLSAWDVPGICERIGLASGERDGAMSGKHRYVDARTASLDLPTLVDVAQKFLALYESLELEDVIFELQHPEEPRISELTRRAILGALNAAYPLFGKLDVFDGLGALNPNWDSERPPRPSYVMRPTTLRDDIQRHFVSNEDYSNEEALERCGALTCRQRRFFALLQKVVDPLVRTGKAQSDLVTALNTLLAADGYVLVAASQLSGHPVYEVRRASSGVRGAVKNLIFASVKTKPDLVLRDAINNDIEIVNDSDALVYDRPLLEVGLSWGALSAWWLEVADPPPDQEPAKALYRRLQQAVLASESPGEFVLYRTYFGRFMGQYGDDLPALIPQVYLHFDPKSASQRGADRALLRQRMDMLLLLDHGVRVVIEVDGRHHFADGERAAPARYAEMASEDRKLRLLGYEVYRFGAAEFSDTQRTDRGWEIGPKSESIAASFFEKLFERHPPRRSEV